MNKAITDGLVLTPPPFSQGLDVWSRGDGRPGSPTYDGLSRATHVPADRDFGSCLELLKAEPVEQLRYMGETPILPGCYLRVKTRVKVISGAFPTLRISAFAGGAGGQEVSDAPGKGPVVTPTRYGEVYEITSIIGTGARIGVDMVWGGDVLYGHFGVEFSGADCCQLRIANFEIEDVTNLFLRNMMNWVDVRDFGAIGDGNTDCRAAFEAADRTALAKGQEVLVSSGVFHLGGDLRMASRVRFQGTVAMDPAHRLVLGRNFDLASYADAFGSRVRGLKAALSVLFSEREFATLDLSGLSVELEEPIDIAGFSSVTGSVEKRFIKNGRLVAVPGAGWSARGELSDHSYVLDFSGFEQLARLRFRNLDIICHGAQNCVLLPEATSDLCFFDCDFLHPETRAIEQVGCNAPAIDAQGCHFGDAPGISGSKTTS